MFVELSNSEELFDTLRHLPSNRPILFTRPPQCGKTGEIFKLLQTAEYHKTSAVILFLIKILLWLGKQPNELSPKAGKSKTTGLGMFCSS